MSTALVEALARKKALEECEAIVERGASTFVETGQALARIHNERLYFVTHKSFKEYMEQRWPFTRQWAYKLIGKAKETDSKCDEDNSDTRKEHSSGSQKSTEATSEDNEGSKSGDAEKKEDAKPEPAKDKLDTPIPEALLPVFNSEFSSLLALFTQASKKAKEICETPAGVRFAGSFQRFEIGMKEVRRVVRFDAPYCVCRKCLGKSTSEKCYCKGTGWLTEAEYGQLPTEFRE